MKKFSDSNIRVYDYEKVCGTATQKDFPAVYQIKTKAVSKNQGDINACVGCALAEIAEIMWKKEFSEGYIYGRLRGDNDKYQGMYVDKTLDLWKKIGIVPLSEFGMLKEMPEMRTMIMKYPNLDEVAKNYKLGGYARISLSNKDKADLQIKEALMSNEYGLVGVIPAGDGLHCVRITGWEDSQRIYYYQDSYGNPEYKKVNKTKLEQVYVIFPEEITVPFKDVDENEEWSYGAIKNMYMSGLINGTSETTFEPDRNITRKETAAIVDRLSKVLDEKFERIYKILNEELNK